MAAILAAPVARYRISQKTGINEGQLPRFVRSHVGLSLETVDVFLSSTKVTSRIVGWSRRRSCPKDN